MAKNSVDILIKARDEASKQFGSVGKSVAGLAKSMAVAGAGIAAAGVALGVFFAGKTIKEGLESFAQQEAATIKLSKALELLGKKYQTNSFSGFAGEMQKVTTYADEVVLDVMALGASMGKLSGSDLQNATKAAMGLAEAFGMDLNTAMTLVSKAAQGNTSALGRYGIKVDENLSTQEKFNAVVKQGIALFPMATSAATTYSGSITQMKNAIDDAKEEIGAGFAPVIMSLAAKIKEFAEQSKEHIISFIETSKIYLRIFSENWGIIFELGAKSATLHIIGFVMDIKHWFTVALPQYLSWFRDNWRNVFMDIFNGTKAVISNLWTNFKNFFTAVWDWLKGGDFEFAWTPLLDGFKKTAEDLPEIAERSLTKIEEKLKQRTGEIKEELANKVKIEIQDLEQKKSDAKAKELAESAKYRGGDAAAMPTAANFKTTGTMAAVESRFLTMAPKNNYYSNMTKYNNETAKNSKQLNVLPKIAESINNLNKLLGGDSMNTLPAGL